MFLLGLVVGILVWQFVVLIFCFIWQDEDKAIVASAGIVGEVFLGIMAICKLLKKLYRRSYYKAALIDFDGRLCYCQSSEMNYWVDRGYSKAAYLRDIYAVEDGWCRKDCSWPDVPNLRYTPLKILKKENAYKLPKSKDNV